ncbi:MAG: RnfH family protein [Gammaproteobacteria bacterium]|nr:RnfH family protein [Gammaproteobacteria bacterium]
MLNITVAYATPERQLELRLKVTNDCTLARAVRQSGMLVEFPELDLANMVVGIHGWRAAWDASLKDQDRIEIYRPLLIDPKLARHLRAKKT